MIAIILISLGMLTASLLIVTKAGADEGICQYDHNDE
jgi:hypothetical protein